VVNGLGRIEMIDDIRELTERRKNERNTQTNNLEEISETNIQENMF